MERNDIFTVDKPLIGDPARVHLLQRVFEITKGNNSKILDVGCGDGSLWLPFLNRIDNLEVFGIDRDKLKIEKGKKEIKEINFFLENIYKLSDVFHEKYFDVVISTQVFSYIRSLERALQEINKVMTKNGRLLFTIGCTRYRKSLRDQLRRRVLGWLIEKHYFREYDEKELEALLRKTGFQVEDIRFYTIHPLKEIHNQVVSEPNKNRFLKLWKEMEDLLVQDEDFLEKGKPYCLTIFMECIKI